MPGRRPRIDPRGGRGDPRLRQGGRGGAGQVRRGRRRRALTREAGMELREIEIFLVLAEELHFGRTAQRLYLPPARVSQTIRTLEQQVDGQLFERTSRSVRLTPLGERLRDGLRPAYDEIHTVIGAVREAATGVSGELRISIYSYLAAGPSFTHIIRAFEERHPGCRTAVRELNTIEALGLLRQGELDAIAAWLPIDEPDLTVGPILAREERVLLVPAGHRLAERGHATLEDLGEHTVVAGLGMPEITLDTVIPRTTPSGRTIERRHGVRTSSRGRRGWTPTTAASACPPSRGWVCGSTARRPPGTHALTRTSTWSRRAGSAGTSAARRSRSPSRPFTESVTHRKRHFGRDFGRELCEARGKRRREGRMMRGWERGVSGTGGRCCCARGSRWRRWRSPPRIGRGPVGCSGGTASKERSC
ncbi:MAG: LysR family transcriptional regulator [Streptosporangiales bacterium]|nr:LysR family transcriptional regulator [Streptosporangiales bacterium]